MKVEEVGFITDDRWMKEGGQLDATDHEILNEASQNGRVSVRVINIREMFESMQKTDSNKFKRFRKEMEKNACRSLTFDELVELGRKANERQIEFAAVASGMTLGQAAQVRSWRVDGRMTWRRVARAAYGEGWYDRDWWPPANQIMGMALCEKAALLFNENYREDPWN